MVSVLVPVRERIVLFDHMLSSLYETVSDPAQVEVIARIDEDDAPMIAYLATRHDVIALCRPRIGYAGNSRMVNDCAAVATGDLLLVANDDLEFQTSGWDQILTAVAQRYLDGIFTLNVDTVLNNANCCFPCTSRRVVELLGGVFDERLLYPDIWLRDVLQAVGRAVRVPEVTIAHRWQGMTPEQADAAGVTRTPAYVALYAQCVSEGIARLAPACQEMAC